MTFDFDTYDDSLYNEFPKQKVIEPDIKENKLDSSFDFDLYDDSEYKPTPGFLSNLNQTFNPFAEFSNEAKRLHKEDPFHKIYDQPEYTDKEIENFSPLEKAKYYYNKADEVIHDYKSGINNAFLSGATFGATDNIEMFRPKEYHRGKPVGEALGVATHLIPYTIGLNAVTELMTASKYGLLGLRTLGMIGAGAAESGVKQALDVTLNPKEGKGIDYTQMALEGALFGFMHLLVEGGIGATKWFKGLNPKQRMEVLRTGDLPKDLSLDSLESFEKNVLPELRAAAEAEYKEAFEKNIAKANFEYKQKLANVKAEHENKLSANDKKYTEELAQFEKSKIEYEENIQQIEKQHKIDLENNVKDADLKYNQSLANTKAKHEMALRNNRQQYIQDSIEYRQAQNEYNDAINKIELEHQENVAKIQKENEQILSLYNEEMNKYEQERSFRNKVKEAITPEKNPPKKIDRKITKNGKDIGLRPSPTNEQLPTLRNKIGNIFSPEEVTNTANAGKNLTKTVQRIDKDVGYKKVKDAYDLSRKANEGISDIHEQLVKDLLKEIEELEKIPVLSRPRAQLKNDMKEIVDQLATFDESGNITGYREIENQILLDQAQELRYKVDYDFSHGQTNKIFNKTIGLLQDATEVAAQKQGKIAAVDANILARKTRTQWAKDFDNDYIRTLRDNSNYKFTKAFDDGLNIDEFKLLEKVFEESPADKPVLDAMKRKLVDKKLIKFTKGNIDKTEFNETLGELKSVITDEEEQLIRQQFNESQKTKYIPAKKIESKKIVEKPKLKTEPKEPTKPKLTVKEPKEKTINLVTIPNKQQISQTPPTIPKFTGKPPVKEEIVSVKIPNRQMPLPNKEMQEMARLMNMSPEKAMKLTDSVSGIRQLKKVLSKTENGKKAFTRATQDKLKRIVYKNKVEPTGNDLYEILNDEHNYSIIKEILGAERAEEIRLSAKEIGKDVISHENRKELIKKLGTLKVSHLLGIF